MKRASSLVLAAALAGAGANAQTSGNGANTAASTAPAISATVPSPPPALVPVAPPPAAAPAISSWVVSETRSPVDYSPVAIATASVPDGSPRLSIQCRGGRTEMLVATMPGTRIEEHTVSYAVNGGPAVAVAITPPMFGSGLALKGDIAAFLAALPEQGEISLSVTNRQGTVDGRYALGGLKTLTARLKAPCQWRN